MKILKAVTREDTLAELYTLLAVGQLVMLDKDFNNASEVEVVYQSPKRLFTTIKDPQGSYAWDVMTNRLTPYS
jgi:hypothetical protein